MFAPISASITQLRPGRRLTDVVADGMPDAWETANGLDPTDGDDHGTVRPSGYTAIEEYVNEFSPTSRSTA